MAPKHSTHIGQDDDPHVGAAFGFQRIRRVPTRRAEVLLKVMMEM